MDRTACGRVRVEPSLQGSKGEATLLGVAVENTTDGVTLRLTGEIDISNTSGLASAISAHQDDLQLLDLRQITFIDCQGVQILFDAAARARARGHRMQILPGPALLRLASWLDKQDKLDIAAHR
jgi:anti-anti-sigma factor